MITKIQESNPIMIKPMTCFVRSITVEILKGYDVTLKQSRKIFDYHSLYTQIRSLHQRFLIENPIKTMAEHNLGV